MATREVAEWSMVDDSNTFPPDEGGWEEGMKRSDVNDAARANIGSIRRWYDNPEWLDLTVGASLVKSSATVLTVEGDDFTAYFTANRKVKITEGAGGPTYATVVSKIENGGNTDVTLENFSGPDSPTEIPDDPDVVYLHITSDLNPSVFDTSDFITVRTLTGVAIQAAIDELEAADGGIVLLMAGATYVVDGLGVGDGAGAIHIGEGANPGNIIIQGRGATIQCGVDLNEELLEIHDSSADLVAKVAIEDVIFDGNSANQTGTADTALVKVGGGTYNASFVWFRRCLFSDSYGHGISIDQECQEVWIETSMFVDIGENGIDITPTTKVTESIYISRCTFDNWSARAAITTGAGVRFNSRCTIDHCNFINMDHATDYQIGVWSNPVGTDGSMYGRINGCHFSGTGLNARGIYLQGTSHVVTGCSFNLTGGGTEGIQVEDGGSDESAFHVIAGCSFYGSDRGVRMIDDSEDCLITGCLFTACGTPYTDNGTRNKFSSNHLTACTNGVRLDATATDAFISDNFIEECSQDGVSIAAGANRTTLSLNYVTNITGELLVDAGTATAVVSFKHFYSEILHPHANGGTVEAYEQDTEVEIPDSHFTFTQYADGEAVWQLNPSKTQIAIKISVITNSNNYTFRVRYGTNRGGTMSSDAILLSDTGASTTNDPNTQIMDTSGLNWFQPAADDEVYMTWERTGGGDPGDHTVEIVGSTEGGAAGGTYMEFRLRDDEI